MNVLLQVMKNRNIKCKGFQRSGIFPQHLQQGFPEPASEFLSPDS
jgi:hypothetical protein